MSFTTTPIAAFLRDKVQTPVSKDTAVPANSRPLPVEIGAGSSITTVPSGLTTAGRISEVAINSVTWTALPASPLAARNAMCIINDSAIEIKLNYSSLVPGYVGVTLSPNNQRFYDITDSIIIYAKAASGTPTLTVEELS